MLNGKTSLGRFIDKGGILIVAISSAKEAIPKSHTKLFKSRRIFPFNLSLALGSITSLKSSEIVMLMDREEATPTTVYKALKH